MKNINPSKRIAIICYGISLLIFLVIGLFGVSLPAGDEMGYTVLNFYILMPLATSSISLIISFKRGCAFWLYPVFAVFSGAIISFAVFNTFYMIDLIVTLIPALFGLVIGLFIRATLKK